MNNSGSGTSMAETFRFSRKSVKSMTRKIPRYRMPGSTHQPKNRPGAILGSNVFFVDPFLRCHTSWPKQALRPVNGSFVRASH